MRPSLVTPLVLIGAAVSGHAHVSAHVSAQVNIGVGIGLPGLSIGINLSVFPELVQVPGYPLYYAPDLDSNYFFYDGMYWIFQEDQWYTSSWYNGPWFLVDQEEVPVFILRVPVSYYRRPPTFFGGWQRSAPPRWGEHWGRSWEQRRNGWDQWDHRAIPAPAPFPSYQRNYTGDRYPGADQQRDLHRQNYRYQPREVVVRERGPQPRPQPAPAPPAERGRLWEPTRDKARETPPQPNRPRSEDRTPPAPASQPAPRGSERNPPRPQAQPGPGKELRDQKDPKDSKPGQGKGQERDRENREERPKQERWP